MKKKPDSDDGSFIDLLRYKKISFEEDICIHILTVSATLLGVCLTVIGIIRVAIVNAHVQTLADDLLTVNALMFLAACFLSYWALRSRTVRRMHRIEHLADLTFISALCLLFVVCVVLTYSIG